MGKKALPPDWDENGEPLNLLGAAHGALEWLEWMQVNRVPLPDGHSIRLTGAINALRKHLRIDEYPKPPVEGEDVRGRTSANSD